MDNPFKSGEPVTGDFFLSRDNEISEIIDAVRARKNVVIYGERGIGKSSLLAETARTKAKEFIFVRVESRAVADENQFLDCFTREVIRSGVGKAWRVEPALWSLLKTRRMRAALSPDGDPALVDRTMAKMPEHPASGRVGVPAFDLQEEKEPSIRMCPRCGRPLKWIGTYKRYFCYSCKKYAPRQKRALARSGRDWEPSAPPDSCPECSSPMRYVHRYADYYCPKCAHYPRMERRLVSEPWARDEMMMALDLPQRLSELKDKPVVVMLDDIQEMAEIGDGRVLEAMRLKFEEHEEAAYVFAGNPREIMQKIFEDRNGAFYKFAKVLDLGRIPDADMERFLMSRFRSAGGRLSEGGAKRIVGVSEGYPDYAQQIGHELFHISTMPEMGDVETAIEKVVRRHSQVYSLLWESIKSSLQRRYLFAIAREPGVPRGESFIRRYGLRSRSHVQRVEIQLEARGIISRSEILDPMFVMWLRQSNSL